MSTAPVSTGRLSHGTLRQPQPMRQDGPMRPMLATPTTAIPRGREWVHEVKWDGMRVLADVSNGVLTLTSRAGNDVTASYPELEPLAGLFDDMLLDGEV